MSSLLRSLPPPLRACLAATLLALPLAAATPATREFDIPAGPAAETLKRFAAQSGHEIVFASDRVDRIVTNPVRGRLTPADAIGALLANTGLRASLDVQTGTYAVRENTSVPNVSRAAPVAAVNPAAPDDRTVVLEPFTVDTTRDSGYLARRSVSVSGLNTPVQDLAQSLEIFTEEFIADVGATSIDEVLYYSAAIASSEHNAEGMSPQTIRGMSNNFILRNGFRAGRVNTDAVNLDRTEIVKGASAILYGQSVVGGVINYVTKTPRARPRTSLSLATGSFDLRRASLDSTGPLGSDKVLYRLLGTWQESGQWIDWGYNDVKFLSPKLAFLPFKALRLDVGYERYARRFLFAGSIPFNGSDNNRPFDPPPPIDFDVMGPGGGVDHRNELWDLQARLTPAAHTALRFAATYSERSIERTARGTQSGVVEVTGRRRTGSNPGTTTAALNNNQGRINRNMNWGHDSAYRLEGVTTFSTRIGATKTFYGTEFDRYGVTYRGRANNPFFGRAGHPYANGQLGLPAPVVYFDTFKQFLTGDPGWVDAIGALNSTTDIVYDTTSAADDVWGYYATVQHTIPNEKLIVSGGVRFDDDNLEDYVPQFGIVFKPRETLSIYALLSRSWLYQATGSLPLPDGTDTGYRGPLPPQNGRTKEIGVKADLGRAYVTLAAFDMENSGKTTAVINPNYNPNLPPTHINSNPTVAGLRERDYSRGWEATAVVQLAHGVQSSLSYMHAEAATEPANVGEDEIPLLGAPRNAFTAWTRYNIQRGPLQGLGLAFGIKYAAPRRLGGQGDYTDPDRWVYEAAAFYRTRLLGRDVRMQVNVKNLEDELYFWDRARYAPPLTWRWTFNTHF